MKRLTCEMCGTSDLIKQDGVFVCQTCGTKYSLEEAKKMIVEGSVEVTGTVKVDNSASVNNLLKLAETAFESGNKTEALSYANRVLESETENYRAWLIKAKIVGWQSTAVNIKIEEAISAFAKAIQYAPEEENDSIKAQAGREYSTAIAPIICQYQALP